MVSVQDWFCVLVIMEGMGLIHVADLCLIHCICGGWVWGVVVGFVLPA
jgi:hypothetical protein